MAGPNTPIAHMITAVVSVVATWEVPVYAHNLEVVNAGTGAAFITVDNSVPTVNGDNQFYVPAGGLLNLPLNQPEQAEGEINFMVQAISAAALSLWVTVTQ